MFQPWRTSLRQVQTALEQGQLDEASEALCQGNLREFWPAQRLASRLVDELVARGRRHALAGETLAGWRDLELALRVGASDAATASLREALMTRALEEVDAYLAAGEPNAALTRLADLEKRQMLNRSMRESQQLAQRMIEARIAARRGRFVQAADELAPAIALRPGLAVLAGWQDEFRRKGEEHRRLARVLHEQLTNRDWNGVLDTANRVLELAPDDGPARDARRRAWSAVGTALAESLVRPLPGEGGRLRPQPRRVENRPMNGSPDGVGNEHRPPEPQPAAQAGDSSASLASAEPSGPRFLLWVDAVGGYLVCQGAEISLGQPVPGSYVDVPILGDLSRLHAKIRRDGEGYLLEPVRPTKLNGQLLTRTAPLSDGSQIELGSAVKLVFRRPHPLSGTARLDLVSRHRTQPAVDGVILMADTCVLGPGAQAHIRCPDWQDEVVLAGRGDQLVCRATGKFAIDGVEVHERGQLTPPAHVAGDDYSLSLEKI